MYINIWNGALQCQLINKQYSNSMRRNQSSTALPQSQSHSMAYKYGITTKQNNPLGSIGLNPNLNIQDEYIQNLLKQIHFMNMQIKLIKQKQLQSDNNALWNVINRTNQPMTVNIIESSSKCTQMKKQIDSVINKLEKDNIRLANSQGALKNQIQYLERKKSQIQHKHHLWIDQSQQTHTQLQQTLKNNQSKLKHILQEIQKQKIKNKQLKQKQNISISQQEGDRSKNQKEALQIKNDETIQEMMQNDLIGQISLVKILTEALIKKFQQNAEYIQAKQENYQHKAKISQTQKNVANANFQLMQLLQSIKMAQVEREKQIKQRKRITEQYQHKKIMLSEISAMNNVRKDKQIMNRKKQSQQIHKAEEQSCKLEKNLQQLKKKLIKSQEANYVVSGQVTNYQRSIMNLQNNKKILLQKIQKLKQYNAEADNQLAKLISQLTVKQDCYTKTLSYETNIKSQILQLEKQLQYLRGRRQLLNRNTQLKDVINQINILDLQQVVIKNNQLNSTVASLMTKWDQIKNFSRI